MLIKPLFFSKSKSFNVVLIRMALVAFFYFIPVSCSERKQKFDPGSLTALDSEGIPVKHFYLFPKKGSVNQSGLSYAPGKPIPSSFSIEHEPNKIKQSPLHPMHIDLSADEPAPDGSLALTPPSFIASPSVNSEQTQSRKRPAQSKEEGIQKKLRTLATKTTKLQQELAKTKDENKKIIREQDELGAQCQTLATDHDKVCSKLTVIDQNMLEFTNAYFVLAKQYDELKVKHLELKQGAEAVVGKMAADVLKIVQSMQARILMLEQQAAQVAPLQQTVAELSQRIKSFSPDFQLPPLFPALQTRGLGVEEDL